MDKAYRLRHPYISVGDSFGGSQSWFESFTMRQSGCGVVAAGDVLLYLGLHRRGCRTEEMHGLFYENGKIPQSRYQQYLRQLRRRYFPVLPGLGMSWLVLLLGMNRYFHKHKIKLGIRWSMRPKRLTERIGEMLQKDFPVILAIGPNFPPFFRRQKLKLYVKEGEGAYRHVTQTRAHFVVVTGMEEGKLEISSWGKRYYIDLEEYQTYARKSSNVFLCSICYLHEYSLYDKGIHASTLSRGRKQKKK